jgi:hypothetical protein
MAVAVALAAATIPAGAINLSITPADIERALTIARDQERARERFHTSYIVTVTDPFVERIEIVTEYRRVVLLAEDRIRKGDRAFAYSGRLAANALEPWRNRVSVIVRLRFHPHNAYVDVPRLEVSVDGPNADLALIGVLKEPVLALIDPANPGGQVPILGAVAEGVFDAKLIGQTRRLVTVFMDGKVLIRQQVDFAAVE